MQQAQAGQAVSNQNEVSRSELPFEYMLGALRLREGFELAHYRERTGLPLSTVTATLQQAQQRGLLDLIDTPVIAGASSVASTAEAAGAKAAAAPALPALRAVPTEKGFDFLSDLQALFMPEATKAGA